MSDTNKLFIDAVTKSRVLSPEQKTDLLKNPELFPENYKVRLIVLLSEFDDHSKARERYLHEKLHKSYKEFVRKLVSDGVPESKRVELLAKARAQIEGMFTHDAA